MKHSEEIISILQEEIAQYDNRTRRSESGTILEIGDGIATGWTVWSMENWWNLKRVRGALP